MHGLISLLSLYENGPSVKSIVGATLPSLQPRREQADPARHPDDWFTIAEVLRQRHGWSYDASRIASRTASEEPTHIWVGPPIGPFLRATPRRRRSLRT
jgi:hypothetical protein